MKKTVKTDTAFFRNLSRATFNSLSEYRETMESKLGSMKEEDRKRIEEDLKKLELSDEDEYREWDLAMQNHTATFDMLFANFFRYSFIVLLYLIFEDWLYRLCVAVHDIKGYKESPPTPSRDILNTYKNYLVKAGVKAEGGLWQDISDFNKVRNCIAHNSGCVKRSRYEPRLRTMAQKAIGIGISSYENRGEIEPLYLENDMLIIEPQYCESVVQDIKQLFEKLCDAASLYEIDFSSIGKSSRTEAPSGNK